MSPNKNFAISIVSHDGIGETDEHGETVRNLTGSCHELVVQYHDQVSRILVDVGGYQGTGVLNRNIQTIAKGVAAVVLTHPHMDHIGEFACLYHGDASSHFQGRVIATPGTKRTAYSALQDGAKIQLQQYERALVGGIGSLIEKIEKALTLVNNYEKRNSGVSPIPRNRTGRAEKSGEEGINKRYKVASRFLEPYQAILDNSNWKDVLLPKPKYTPEDVERAIPHIEELPISKRERALLDRRVFVSFYNAGHIIGSASALFKIIDPENKPHYVLFTGDLGSYKWDLHINGLPEPPNNLPLDAVVIESTYGGKTREPFEIGKTEFETSLINAFTDIADTPEKKGRNAYTQVIHACFSLDRLQNILFRVITLKKSGKLPKDIKIYVDSPLGIAYIDAYLEEAKRTLQNLRQPKQAAIKHKVGADYVERERRLLEDFIACLSPENLQYTRVSDTETREALQAHQDGRKRIIITASGMANGGPVMTYLGAFAGDPHSAFYFPGYLAEGTLGQQLAGPVQNKSVVINGKKQTIQARMKQFSFLSGHGDEEDLIGYLESLKLRKTSKIIVVHGNRKSSSTALAHTITRQLGIDAERILTPDIEEEIYVYGDGINRCEEKNPSTSEINTFIKELEINLHTQDALLEEKKGVMAKMKKRDDTQESGAGTIITDNEVYTNLGLEIFLLQEDIAAISGIIKRLRGLSSDGEITEALRKEVKKYQFNFMVPVPQDKVAVAPSSTAIIQIRKVPSPEEEQDIGSPKTPEKELTTSPYFARLRQVISDYNQVNDDFFENIYTSISGPVIDRFRSAIRLIEELQTLYNQIRTSQATLASMQQAQEHRVIDEIPAAVNGKPVDRRKRKRLLRLKYDHASYLDASSTAIGALEERIRENAESAKGYRESLRDSIGIFNNPEQVGIFLATGKIPNKKRTQAGKRTIGKQIQEQSHILEQAKKEQEQIQEIIKKKQVRLKELETIRKETERILNHVPEHIDALLQSLKKKLFGIKRKLSTEREIDEELSRIDGEISNVTHELRNIPSIIAKLQDLGVTYAPEVQESSDSTLVIYSRKKVELEATFATLRRELGRLKGKGGKVLLHKTQKNEKEMKIAAIERKLEEVKTELDTVNTILTLLPDNLSARYNRLDKIRKESLKRKEQLVCDGSILSLKDEAQRLEQMISVLSEKVQEREKLMVFLENEGVAYIPDGSSGMKTQEIPQDDSNTNESTYATYKKHLQSTDKQLAQLRNEIVRLEKTANKIGFTITRIERILETLHDGISSHTHESIDVDEAFWLPHISRKEIAQGINRGISAVLENMTEYKELKQNLARIKGMMTSDSTMTEAAFTITKSALDTLAKENEELRLDITKKLQEFFSTDNK